MTSTHQNRIYSAGTRRFVKINWLGLWTLSLRETRRFLSVWQQTVFAPLMTAALFVIVFALALGSRRGDVMGVPYLQFLGPGILMMAVLQNAFANTSSSIMSAKMQGNIVDTLMPPLSAGELVTGYLFGAVARATLVATTIGIGLMLALDLQMAQPAFAVAFILLAALTMGGLGIIASIIAEKFDQMSAVTNFVITPLTFLSGTFYSVHSLPKTFYIFSLFNPIFYLIDGARYGFTGQGDASPWLGLLISSVMAAIVITFALHLLRIGYRMKP